MEILALIPARSGSKSVKDKNIRDLLGRPLLAHSIAHARASKHVTRVIVSTDDEHYASVAREHGAEAPFLRPSELSGDTSTDLEAFQHALSWLKENENYEPDLCVHLRPTHPVRSIEDLDAAIEILMKNEKYDSVRSIVPAPETAFKMWFRDDAGMLNSVVAEDRHPAKDPYNLPRQVLPKTYLQNASIDVTRASVILEKKSMTGDQVFGYVMQDFFDIDTEIQLQTAQAALSSAAGGKKERKTFVFDIDGVIAAIVPDLDYEKSAPMQENIETINMLYEQGHEIILFTARGSKTGIDWTDVTTKQMKSWGVKHHELRLGKPAADFYIDDRFIPMADIRKLIKGQNI